MEEEKQLCELNTIKENNVTEKENSQKELTDDETPAKKFKSNGDASVKEQRTIVNKDLLRKLVSVEEDDASKTKALAMMPSAKVETAQENWKNHHLKHDEVTDYCKKLFKFKYVNIMRFKYVLCCFNPRGIIYI